MPEKSAKKTSQPAPRAEIRSAQGAPTLYLQGTIAPPIAADLTPDADLAAIQERQRAGVSLFRLRDAGGGWSATSGYDLEGLGARIKTLLEAVPEAWYWAQVAVDPPQEWLQKHRNEQARFCLPPEQSAAETPCVSWASEAWREKAGAALHYLTRAIYGSALGARCLGIEIACGEAGDWRHPQAERMPDVGRRMQEAFRRFAQDRYRRNPALISQAWNVRQVDYAALTCPDAEERRRGGLGALRVPNNARRLLDYYECFYQQQSDALLHFARIVKEASKGEALVGATYGAIFGNETLAEGGFCYPDAIFGAEEIDFFLAAPVPNERFLSLPTGTLRLRGKYLFCVAPSVETLPQASALALAHQSGVLLPPETKGERLRAAAELAQAQAEAPRSSRQRKTEVAFLFDPTNLLCVRPDSAWLNACLLRDQLRELTRAGAPFEVYALSDLFERGFPDHKVSLFANTFYLTETERRKIEGRVKRTEQVVLWGWGSGVANEKWINHLNAQQLTGVKMRVEREERPLSVKVVVGNDALTRGVRPGFQFGIARPIMPHLMVTDSEAKRLGTDGDGKTALAVRQYAAWKSVAILAAPIPANLLRNALKMAGCHLFVAGAEPEVVVQTDGRFLMATSSVGGSVAISLPGAHEVKDLRTGEVVASFVSEFRLTLAPGVTRFLEARSFAPRRA